MSTEVSSTVTPATTALFQKAHSKIVTLQKIDDQLAALMDQRRKLQDELREIQSQINVELDRIIKAAEDRPAQIFAQAPEPAPSRRPPAPRNAIRLEVAEAG